MNEIIHQYKKTVIQFLFIFGIGILLLILALILNTARKTAFVGSGADERATITVSGTGKLDKLPDTARISFTVSDTQKSLVTAQKNVSDTVTSITDALTKAGIRKEDVTTETYNSYPKYEYPQIRCFAAEGCPQPGNPALVGYTLSHNVTVSIEDLEKAEQVLGIIGGFTVENISGPSFGFSDEEQIERDVRALAIENAEDQAEALAKDLGVRIVRIVSYSDQSYGGAMFDSRKAYALTSAMPENAPNIPVGEQNLEKTVSVTYEIR
jgi:uncharacterized protein YggE